MTQQTITPAEAVRGFLACASGDLADQGGCHTCYSHMLAGLADDELSAKVKALPARPILGRLAKAWADDNREALAEIGRMADRRFAADCERRETDYNDGGQASPLGEPQTPGEALDEGLVRQADEREADEAKAMVSAGMGQEVLQ